MKTDNDLLYQYLSEVTSRQTTALKEAFSIIEQEFSQNSHLSLRFLDLGCGAGNTYDAFRKLRAGIEWIGLDIDTSPEVDGRSRCDAPFMTFDGVNIPLDDATVDIIYSHQVFEHVRRPNELLSQAYRVLKPGGLLVGSTSHLEPYHSWSYWNYTPYGFASLLTETGFSAVSIRPGIDGLTLILRRLLGFVKINLGQWLFEHESPLNALIEYSGRTIGMKAQRRAVFKLLFCGHFIFIARKPCE